MSTILTKFKVGSTTNFGNDNLEANLSAVIGGSDENKSFSRYTPNGSIKLHITNPEVLDFFKPGEEVYVEFKKDLTKVSSEGIPATIQPVRVKSDGDGHNYILPNDLAEQFETDLDEMKDENFIEKYGDYMTGGSINLTQLYAIVPSK